MSRAKTVRIISIVIAIVIVVAVIGVGMYYLTRPKYVVRAVSTNQEPMLDGRPGDAGWKDAEETEIPLDNGEKVILKAAYTPTKIFIMARYKDETKDIIEQPWEYDGKIWKHGRTCDQLAMFFNINDSVIDFKEKGFNVVTLGLKPGSFLYSFGIEGKASKNGRWPGVNQRGDYWIMPTGLSNQFGKLDDLYMAITGDYSISPSLAKPVVSVRGDLFETNGYFELNTDLWREAKKVSEGKQGESIKRDKPIYMYESGKNINNRPFPYVDEMVEIKDYSQFKKGDKLPWFMFRHKKSGIVWGGSRDDVSGKAGWSDGYWTVEMARELDTGNADDIVFNTDEEENVSFGVLVRSDGRTIRKSVPAILEFLPQGGGGK